MTQAFEKYLTVIKKAGIQSPNRFEVEVVVPMTVQAKMSEYYNDADLSNRIGLLALDTNIPGFTAAVSEIHVGHTAFAAYEKSNGDLNVTFLCAGDMKEHKFFMAWRDSIFKQNHTLEFYDNYISDTVKIKLKNKMDQISRHMQATEAFPITVTDVVVNQGERDTYSTFQVVFKYRKLKTADSDKASADVSSPVTNG